jgi:hypothetical protein
MLAALAYKMSGFQDNGKQLPKEIRFVSKHNNLSLERWENKKIVSRWMMGYYGMTLGNDRNIYSEDFCAYFRNTGYWLLIS